VVEWVSGPELGSVGVSGTEINDGELVELGTTLGSVDIIDQIVKQLLSASQHDRRKKGRASN
jgi:hypothetical protein